MRPGWAESAGDLCKWLDKKAAHAGMVVATSSGRPGTGGSLEIMERRWSPALQMTQHSLCTHLCIGQTREEVKAKEYKAQGQFLDAVASPALTHFQILSHSSAQIFFLRYCHYFAPCYQAYHTKTLAPWERPHLDVGWPIWPGSGLALPGPPWLNHTGSSRVRARPTGLVVTTVSLSLLQPS